MLSENQKVNKLLDERKDENSVAVGSGEKKASKNVDDAKSFMNQIFDEYKDKIIVLDFWATWCGTCLKSIEQLAPVKKEFMNKDVVFVYLTNESSPPKT